VKTGYDYYKAQMTPVFNSSTVATLHPYEVFSWLLDRRQQIHEDFPPLVVASPFAGSFLQSIDLAQEAVSPPRLGSSFLQPENKEKRDQKREIDREERRD
jgi:hypothetical protein